MQGWITGNERTHMLRQIKAYLFVYPPCLWNNADIHGTLLCRLVTAEQRESWVENEQPLCSRRQCDCVYCNRKWGQPPLHLSESSRGTASRVPVGGCCHGFRRWSPKIGLSANPSPSKHISRPTAVSVSNLLMRRVYSWWSWQRRGNVRIKLLPLIFL